jgi:hypothetical protein
MKPFKFFQKETKTDYNPAVAGEAIRFFNDYYHVGNYQIRTNIATYNLRNMFRRPDGWTTGEVSVTPHDNPNMKIVYNISSGNAYPFITGHTILIE